VLAHKLAFSPLVDESFFQQLPAAPAVFLLKGEGEPYVSKTANLRRRLERLLGPPAEHSKRLNLRGRVREIEFSLTGSDFESQLLLYRLLRKTFPATYTARLRLRPATLVKLHLDNAYPRASVTTRLGKLPPYDPGVAGGHALIGKTNLYYGPFPSRVAAEKFASDALDFFKMRRCVEELNPDPAFPGCVYSEMKMCLAPCFKGCSDEEYSAEVSRVQEFLGTRGDSLIRELSDQRERASAALAFEEAATIHTRIEKLKPLISQLPEIIRRIDQLDAVIVQPSAAPGSVCLLRCQHARLIGPLLFNVEHAPESSGPDGLGPRVQGKPQTMESRVQEAISAFAPDAPSTPLERNEQLALLKRWYYRSHRIGEIFFADDQGSWPLRRMVRGIGRVYKGEQSEEFSATQLPAPPS
jgi:excinuclease ABC subunit C